MNFFRLCKILTDHNGCIEWCKEHDLLVSSVKCPRAECSNALSWTVRSSSRDGYKWRCSKRGCNGMASICQNSWFSGSKLSIEKILDWYNYCREVCADRIMNHYAGPIGGPGTTVGIDESKFGKMKYHRGRPIEGKWVFGGICRETKACFLVPVERRDRDTLLPIIRAHILPGTRVMSDLWKAYDCLKNEGYDHLTVNHSLNFVDPDTGAYTQGIENTWWGVKRSLPRTYRSTCGVSNMERIPLETLSSISPTFTRFERTHKGFLRITLCALCDPSTRGKNEMHFKIWIL